MGNTQDSSSGLRDSSSFISDKIERSPYKQINALHIDESLFPHSGIITVGIEIVENYSEDGSNQQSYFASTSKILASTLQISTTNPSNNLLLACEDNYVYVLDPKSLKITKKFRVTLVPTDLVHPDFEIKYKDMTYFEKFTIDAVIAPFEDSFFLGYSTGLIKQFEIYRGDCMRIYNPLPFEHKPDHKDKILPISVENLIIPGIDSISYCHLKETVISNHKKMFTNCFNRSFTLTETPIYTYQLNGNISKKMTLDGTIIKSKVLENRNIYICLTSLNSQVYVFDFVKGTMLLKFTCDVMKDPQNPIQITAFTVLEFEMNHRNQNASFVFNSQSYNKDLIDGDMLFFIGSNGSILLSKLKYENERGAIAWVPLKYMGAALETKDKNGSPTKTKHIKKHVSALEYVKNKDRLFFSDYDSYVYWVDNVMKLVYGVNVESK